MHQTARLIGLVAATLGSWLVAVAAGLFLTLHPAGWVHWPGYLLLLCAPLLCMGVGGLLVPDDKWVDHCTWPVWSGLYLAALLPAAFAVTATFGAGPAYHAAYGQRVEAIVTETGTGCRASATATERDLGRLSPWTKSDGGCGGHSPGDRIDVSVDPLGWAAAVPADQLRVGPPVLVAILTGLLLVLVLAAAGTITTAFRIRRTSW